MPPALKPAVFICLFPILKNLFSILLYTGVRIGEAGALKWSDIDYMNGVIHITKTMTFGKEFTREIGTPKTKASERDIPLNDDIMAVLRRQREQQRQKEKNKILSIENLIFTTVYGHYLNSDSLGKEIQRLTDKAGIERFTVHAFRDTFATRFYENGGDPQILKSLLGHSSLQMTMDLYSQVLPKRKAEEMQKIVTIHTFFGTSRKRSSRGSA